MEGRRVSPLHISPGRDQLHPRFPSAVLGQIPQQGRGTPGRRWPRPPGIGRYAGSRSFGATRENGRSLQTPRPAPPSGASIPPPGEGPLPAHHLIPGDELLQQGDRFLYAILDKDAVEIPSSSETARRCTRSPAGKPAALPAAGPGCALSDRRRCPGR